MQPRHHRVEALIPLVVSLVNVSQQIIPLSLNHCHRCAVALNDTATPVLTMRHAVTACEEGNISLPRTQCQGLKVPKLGRQPK